MNFRAFRLVTYVSGFLISTTGTRNKIKKMYETDPEQASALAHKYIQKATNKIIKITGSTFEVEGLDRIPKDTACLFAANHASYFDIVFTEPTIPGGVGYIAKDSLEKIPGLSAWMRLIHCIFLNRTNMKEGLKTILKGADYLKEGYSMFIFPEGTRSKTGALGEFKPASLKMAQKAKVPVVPVAITGTADIFENTKGLRVNPSHVTITFCDPVYISDMPRSEQKEAPERIKHIIEDRIQQNL